MQIGTNKEAINIAYSFFRANIGISLGIVTIMAVAIILQTLPTIGSIFAIIYAILTLSIQIYIGRSVWSIDTPKDIKDIASNANIKDILLSAYSEAIGATMGFLLITILFMMLFGYIISQTIDLELLQKAISANNVEAVSDMLFKAFTSPAMIIFFIIVLLFTYLVPAVIGRVMVSESAGEAFVASMGFFHPTVWKRVFTNGSYAKIVTIWSLILFVAFMILSILFSSLILLPLGFVVLYMLLLYNAVIYAFAYNTIE